MVNGLPHLVHFRVSHYNEKVRWALDHKGIAHTRQAVVPGWHVPRVRRLTGQNKVPVLVLDGAPMFGSAHILAKLEERYPDPPLYRADPALRARAAELESFFDDEVAPAVRRLFWSTYLDRPADCARMATMGESERARRLWRCGLLVMRPLLRRNMAIDRASLERAHERLASYIDRIEQAIGPSGYLVGERFGVADLGVASVMSALLRPPEFPYPLPEPWPPALRALRESIADRAGCRWVADIYRRHRGTSSEVTP